MKRFFYFLICFSLMLSYLICLTGCSKEPEASEMILGGWTNQSGNAYTYFKIKMEGKWEASVKIADFSSKIIGVKGKASGKWHIEDNSLILTVFESNINKLFKKNSTSFFEIIKLNDNNMELMDTYGLIKTWKAVQPQKKQGDINTINTIRMAPFTVNLNKVRSHDKDRYLCLNLQLVLKDYMPGAQLPKIHPKAREAIIVYLSSLVYKDVKSLEQVKELQEKLKIILNPYCGDVIDKVEIDHVIISSTIERVAEFLIEHSLKARIAKKSDETDSKEKKEEE